VIPTDTIDTLVAVWRSVSELCAPFTETQWKLPTDCPGWTVQDNVSHLIGTERALEGLPMAPAVEELGDHVKNAIGKVNEYEIEARRPRQGAEVLAEWNELVERRTATLRSAADEYFDAPAMTPTGPGTVADFLHIRVLDCYAHEQDIRRAIGVPGNLDSPAAAHTVDRLLRTIPIVVGKRAGTPEGATVVLELTGPVRRTVPVTVVDGRAKVVAESPTEALATIRMDSSTFTTLALGRRPAADLAEGWSVRGDTALGTRVVEQLNMMI
jgi:uncharacterized protein (TIGR03083 family)